MFRKYSFIGAQTFWETFLTNAGRGGVLDTGSDPTERVNNILNTFVDEGSVLDYNVKRKIGL